MKKMIKLCAVLFSSLFVVSSCNINNSTSPNSSPNNSSPSTPDTSIGGGSVDSVSPCKKRTGKNDRAKKLVVYSVNDTHGVIEESPLDYQAGLSKIREFVCADSDYDPDYSIILSAGDMFQGTGLSNLTEGAAMLSVMNSFPFDAMAIGNHEFDWGLDKMLGILKEKADFDVLANNIYYKETGKLIDDVKPYTMIERGGYKVGIVGSIEYGIDSSIMYNKLLDYNIVDDKELTINYAKELKNAGADIVLFLTHQGLTTNVTEIMESSDISAALLGHTHAKIIDTVNGKPVLEARANSQAYTKLVFDETNMVYSYDVREFSQSEISNTKLSSDMQSLLNAWHSKVDVVLNEEVLTTNGSFTRYDNGVGAGSLSRLVTESMYDYAKKYGLKNIIGVYNKGGLRADFRCDTKVCKMTYNDVYQMAPFENEIRYVTVKGSVLQSAIQNHFYYGVDFTTNKLVDGTSFSLNESYNVVTVDYLTTNPNYRALYDPTGGKVIGPKNIYARDMLSEQFKELKSIDIKNYPF